MGNKAKNINEKLKGYKYKYYKNKILKGILISALVLLGLYILVSSLDFTFHFGSILRGFVFFSFIATALYLITTQIIKPLIKLFYLNRGISDEEAAKRIGLFFPNIRDRLLNLIQLQKLGPNSSLVQASIHQRSREFDELNFEQAVDSKSNRKFVRYLVAPVSIAIILYLFIPQLFTDSTNRIVNFTEDYAPEAPFIFKVDNEDLQAFKNEDFTVSLKLEGSAFPENVYIIHKDLKYKMTKSEDGDYEFTFHKIQSDKNIYFEGAGFTSSTYTIKVVNRPNLKGFNLHLTYPKYLNKKNQRIGNVGSLEIPEGTKISWQFNSLNTNELSILFGQEDEKVTLHPVSDNVFEYNKQIFKSQNYGIELLNEYSSNKDKIIYHIEVIPDQYPHINANVYQDTTLYNSITMGGNISDDYGLRKLSLFYKKTGKSSDEKEASFHSLNIPINTGQNSQSFFYQWQLDTFNLTEGDELKYYLQVWDNDGINGSKSSKTGTFVFKLPDKDEIKSEIGEAAENTKNEIDKTLENARELQEKLREAENRIKSKRNINWQDEQLMKELIEERQKIEEELKKLRDKFQDLEEKKQRFNQQQNERTDEKAKQLDKIIDDLMDEETRELYKDLKKLLEDLKNKDEIENTLNNINRKERNLTQELERSLELFKRLQLEQKLEKAIQDIDELAEDQQQLSEETEDQSNSDEEIVDKQEDIENRYEEFQKNMDQVHEMNQDLKSPEPIRDVSEENNEVQKMQQQIKQELKNGKRDNASESQKGAAEKMKKLSQKLSQMKSGMQVMMMQENLDNLRDILHNLLKLSFDQEQLMKEFREVNQSDPRFVALSQQQLKLQDDAKIIEDSLMSLASRVAQISSYVTREVNNMNQYMNESVDAIRDRKKPLASSKQQFAMTSINNLALLLDDTFQQMQMVLSEAMGNQRQNSNNRNDQETLGELQRQLNEQVEQLHKSQHSGRKLSEELAKLAAEQERIRRALKEMQEKYGSEKNGIEGDNGVLEKMEETELDLVNKQITEETIKRQREILTRMLEAEDAMRERDLEEERKGETAQQQYQNTVPNAFEEYFKTKQKEIELLKTVPPKLYPYYKKEVNDYFLRLREQ